MEKEYPEGVRPDVLNYDDIIEMVPALGKYRKLVESAMHIIGLDEVNRIHSRYCHDTGITFARHLVNDEFKIRLRIDNEGVLSLFKTEPFITVSNHPLGALDGIVLLYLVGSYRPDFKVMVNMILNKISAMRPSFIAVDPLKTDDPEKRKVSLQGIRSAMKWVKEGHPLGFFPAGAVAKVNKSLHVVDREWQETVIRLISQLKVPVIPIYFHGHNSAFFNILGMIDWRLRTMRLPKELFRKRNTELHISVGDPIYADEIALYPDLGELGNLLRTHTFDLSNIK